jgi:hypothetical protein
MAKVQQGAPTSRALIHRGPGNFEVVVDRKTAKKPTFTFWVDHARVELTADQSTDLLAAMLNEMIRG